MMNTGWVEIIEPKSREKIYANLETGVCAKFPPPGVTVSRAEDFSDHWWELYDTKSGKYYYCNVDRQETVWRLPEATADGKSMLIIPVAKLQTYLRVFSGDKDIERKDASTQTMSQSTSTFGTQTVPILRTSSSASTFDGSKLKSDVHSIKKNRCNCPRLAQQFSLNHQQLRPNSFSNVEEGINGKKVRHKNTCPYAHALKGLPSASPSFTDNHDSSLSNQSSLSSSLGKAESSLQSYVEEKRDNQANIKNVNIYRQNISLTSKAASEHDHNQANIDQRFNTGYEKRLPASNLSHYLVREARAMGIALISDDEEADDEDIDSDEDYPVDEEDDEEERSEIFRNPEHRHRSDDNDNSSEGWKSLSSDQDEDPDCLIVSENQHNKKQPDIGQNIILDRPPARASSENIYDDVYEQQDSTNFAVSDPREKIISQEIQPPTSHKIEPAELVDMSQYRRNLVSCSSSASDSRDPGQSDQFNHDFPGYREQENALDDEDRSPAQLLSQQLNHYKLVNNFKKKGSSTSHQFNEVVNKLNNLSMEVSHSSEKPPASTLSQLKNFSLHNQPSDHHLREVSTLSTLPRPHKFAKSKPAVSKQLVQQNSAVNTDSIYDNVENGCGYHSDSEPAVAQQQSSSLKVTSNVNSKPSSANDGTNSLDSGAFSRGKESRGSTFSVESFAKENLTRYPKKGSLNAMLFNRKVKWSRMITWTRSTIKQSMITSLSTNLNSDAINCFKLIQQFMGDRKVTLTKKLRTAISEAEAAKEATSKNYNNSSIRKSWSKSPTKSNTNSLRRTLSDAGGNVPDIIRDELAQELISIGCSKPPLRDEIYVQLARQVTQNPSQQSVEWGLILMAIALSYFSPSTKFSPFLFSFLENHDHLMARDVCQPRLEKRIQNNWTTYCRKPSSGSEITIVRLSITKWPQYCGVFGESLDHMMKLQSCSSYLRTLKLPWILTVLGEKLLDTGGARTEGIFRCAADCDVIAQLKLEIDCLDFRRITDSSQVRSLFANVVDPHVIAGLLKLFFRELPNSIFPCQLYDVCLQAANDISTTNQVVMEKVPDINRCVIGYIINLLQVLAKEENVTKTKMDTSNLSMVWAPNLLRSTASFTIGVAGMLDAPTSVTSTGSTLDRKLKDTSNAQQITNQSQSILFEKARQEVQFIHQLVMNLDTTYIVDVV